VSEREPDAPDRSGGQASDDADPTSAAHPAVGGGPPRRSRDAAHDAAHDAARRAAHDATLRPLATYADLRACVALQYETWGADFGEAVPPAILKVAQRLGGVAAGAFDAGGRLLGFVFGLTGVERGRVVHWSDMLAVRPELRDAGLGRRLKAWQRDAARAAGAEVMYWTYDPLVARNAHLNFNRLGVRAHEYVEDMYGDSASTLHRGLGTDRLVVAWPLVEAPLRSCCPSGDPATLPAALRDAPLLNGGAPAPVAEPRTSGADTPDMPGAPGAPGAPDARRIAIPLDVHAVLAADAAAAARWRAETRQAFRWALRRGYGVAGVYRDADAGLAHYVLTRGVRHDR
jgi:predicted GNAT superfamily acetyltransferase